MFSPPSPKHSLRLVPLALALALPFAAVPFAALAADAPAAPAAAPGLQLSSSDPVVATYNGKQVHKSDIIEDQRELGPQAMQQPLEKIYPSLLDRHLKIIMLSDAAKTDKLQDDPEVKAKVAKAENTILAQTYISRVAEKAVTDATLKAAYDELVKKESGTEEVHAQHILVKTEAEAKAIIDQLNKGADFGKLADQKSIDKGSAAKANGGDLGWFRKEDMVPEFADAAFALKKGEYTKTPIKTQFGFHVIKLDDRRAAQPKTFDEAKPELHEQLAGAAVQAKLKELKDKGKVEVFNLDGSPIPDTSAAPAPAAAPDAAAPAKP